MSVYSVNVYPSSTTIKTGNWYYGAYAVVNASSNCCTDVEWYSDSPSVASVNQSTGYIYGVSPGTTKIYARSKVDSSKSDYITVTVTSGTICVDSVTLNRSSISLEKGDTFTLSATVCPTNANNKTISWRSSNTSVATVSGGVVTAKARGHAYIYAEAQDGSGEYDSCYVNVTEDILVSSVTLNYSSYTLNANGSVLLRETVCPTNATNKCVEWTSDKPHIAFVNPDSGFVTAQGTGTAKIRATAQDGSSKYAECTITVNPPVAVTDVELCPTSLTMNVGDIEYLCASITPSNATNQTVTWCSSNENVATVGLYTGKVTAKKAGTTTITATTADGGYQASCTVKVFIDTVTIQKDGDFNKVVFNKSGKVWRCINQDMIFSDVPSGSPLFDRSNLNFYGSTEYNNNIITYTDEEIKLLYAIDPHGVAYYIQTYVDKLDCSLKDMVQYKDRIFRLLFNKEPRYFTQGYNGEWYVTDDKTDLNNVISESESYFGMHPAYDFLRALVNAIDFATAVLCTIIPNEAADTIVEVGGTLLKVGILYHNEEYQMAFEEIASLVGDVIFDPKDELIETVFEVFSVFTSFNELINSLSTKPRYYCDILDYCINKVDYNVILELENGDKMKLKDIKESVA